MKKAIICDIDGTLAIRGDRGPFEHEKAQEDKVNTHVSNLLSIYKEKDYDIIIISGRQDRFEELTRNWLLTNSIPFDKLYLRNTEDNGRDSDVKKDIFMKYVKDLYEVEFVLDDRNQVVDMWRKELNLKCFQVDYEIFNERKL